MNARPDHELVGRLLELADGTDDEIAAGVRRAGIGPTLRVMFGELLPRLTGEKDVVISYRLNLTSHSSSHEIRVRPEAREVEITAPAAEPQLSFSHDTRGFTDLFRVVLGGRGDLAAVVFGGGTGDPALAERLATGFAARPGLSELARRHGSCKWGAHWEPTYYEPYLKPLRNKRIKILEIGIGGHHLYEGGESLRMWRDYFPRGLITGVDLYDKSNVAEQRIRVLQGDQGDQRFLSHLADHTAPFDVVIDDGSHVNEHVITAFQHLFPHLNDGGLYIIEDIHSSYWPAFGGRSDDRTSPATTMGFVKARLDGLQHQEFLWPADYRPSYLDEHVAGVHVHHHFAVLEKGPNTLPSSKPNWMRYLDLERPMAALEIGPDPAGSGAPASKETI